MRVARHPIRGLVALSVLLVATSGCEIAPSFHLPADREQLVADPSTLGLWFAEEEDVLAFYRVSSPAEDTAWHSVEIFGGECEAPAVLEVAIAAIGEGEDDERLLILTSEVDGIAIPVYWSGRLWIERDKARVAFLNGAWLSEHLLEKPSALAHVRRTYDQGDPFFDSDVLITASATEIQTFLRQHPSSEDSWFEWELTRMDRTRALELAQEWGCLWPELDEDQELDPDAEPDSLETDPEETESG